MGHFLIFATQAIAYATSVNIVILTQIRVNADRKGKFLSAFTRIRALV